MNIKTSFFLLVPKSRRDVILLTVSFNLRNRGNINNPKSCKDDTNASTSLNHQCVAPCGAYQCYMCALSVDYAKAPSTVIKMFSLRENLLKTPPLTLNLKPYYLIHNLVREVIRLCATSVNALLLRLFGYLLNEVKMRFLINEQLTIPPTGAEQSPPLAGDQGGGKQTINNKSLNH